MAHSSLLHHGSIASLSPADQTLVKGFKYSNTIILSSLLSLISVPHLLSSAVLSQLLQQRVRVLLFVLVLLFLVLSQHLSCFVCRLPWLPSRPQLRSLTLWGGSAEASSGLPQALGVYDLTARVQPSGGWLLHHQGERGSGPQQRQHVQKYPGEFIITLWLMMFSNWRIWQFVYLLACFLRSLITLSHL